MLACLLPILFACGLQFRAQYARSRQQLCWRAANKRYTKKQHRITRMSSCCLMDRGLPHQEEIAGSSPTSIMLSYQASSGACAAITFTPWSRKSHHWRLNPIPSAYKTHTVPLSYRDVVLPLRSRGSLEIAGCCV